MNYKITGNENVLFNNNAFYCIGTGRMGLALQKQYFEQLKLVQEKIGFEHIRGHGLFHDDMAIYIQDRLQEFLHLESRSHILNIFYQFHFLLPQKLRQYNAF